MHWYGESNSFRLAYLTELYFKDSRNSFYQVFDEKFYSFVLQFSKCGGQMASVWIGDGCVVVTGGWVEGQRADR